MTDSVAAAPAVETTLDQRFPEAVTPEKRAGYAGFVVAPEKLVEVATAVRDEMGYDFLSSVTGVDYIADGKLVDYKAKMEMSPEMAAMTAQFCATVTMMFTTLAGAFSQLSRMNWVPQHGWAYSGGEWTVAVGGNKGVFIETVKADFNKLFEVLVGKR